jgi:hypothetical protein
LKKETGNNKFNDLIGKKYNDRTIVSLYEIRREGQRNRLKVEVECKCGKKDIVDFNQLKCGNVKRCLECYWKSKRCVNVGDVFDNATVIGFEKMQNNRYMAKCECKCGNIYNVRPESLKRNKFNDCGCIHHYKKGINDMSGTIIHRIKSNAKTRNISFSLTDEFLWDLYINQNKKCALSGLPIEFSPDTTKGGTASLDRINSSIGYIESNVQWVHKDINKMKMDFTEKRFVELCKLISENKK